MSAEDWDQLLRDAPTSPYHGNLVRCLPHLTFLGGTPPSFLFTSGRPNRGNPRGVDCLYLAEDRETALAEYEKYWPDPQPELTFHGQLKAEAILDLGDSGCATHFALEDGDFFDPFRLVTTPTRLQQIGAAIGRQTRVVAIRFPSEARHALGEVGYNFVIYRDSLQSPNFLRILGPGGASLEDWPIP
jgi:RES domain-containing protein